MKSWFHAPVKASVSAVISHTVPCRGGPRQTVGVRWISVWCRLVPGAFSGVHHPACVNMTNLLCRIDLGVCR